MSSFAVAPKLELVDAITTTAAHPQDRVKIVLFSGGSGTQTICDTLIDQPQVDLTVLINAYDDGHSTGRIRRFVPGMLGPSDVRKNINRLMPQDDRAHRALRALSDFRLAKNVDYKYAHGVVAALARRHHDLLPAEIREQFDLITVGQADRVSKLFDCFYRYSAEQFVVGNLFDYRDCALGNILFAGCFLTEGRDFNRTVAALSDLYELRATLLNVTAGENLFLAARKEDGSFLRGEFDIVAAQNGSMISELLLLDSGAYLASIDGTAPVEPLELEAILARSRRIPEINGAAAVALKSADVIIYGPGTQHSSLFPSYLTRGIAESIAANKTAEKVFVSNIRRDFDIPKEDSGSIARKFLHSMRRNGEIAVNGADVVTKFFFQRPGTSHGSSPSYVPFEPTAFDFPLETVRLRNWEGLEGKHSGSHVLNELRKVIESRSAAVLKPVRQVFSVIVPMMNDAATIEQALQSLVELNFNNVELAAEVIAVDGGSTDETFALASSVAGVRVFRTAEGRGGRGAALRTGIEHACGDLIAFFPPDLRYRTEDLFRVILSILNTDFKAVIGTRDVKCTSVRKRLSQIYGNSASTYLLSKYGGMCLSMATLLLYDRYIADPLTCLMAFESDTLHTLDLQANGLGLSTEIIAKLCRKGERILEVPVQYKPRTRAERKQRSRREGVRAFLPLLSTKYQSSRSDEQP